jgi:hypothetical protein
MFADETIENISNLMSNSQFNPRPMMVTLFNREQRQGRTQRLLAWIMRRSNSLKTLCQCAMDSLNGHYLGTRSVAIDEIKGSESKAEDFDTSFHPLNGRSMNRWVNVAVARKSGVALPPVELIKIGEDYYVRDGHHRVSVAQAFGENFIDADVYEW